MQFQQLQESNRNELLTDNKELSQLQRVSSLSSSQEQNKQQGLLPQKRNIEDKNAVYQEFKNRKMKQRQDVQQLFWKNQCVLQKVFQFLKNRDVCNLQQINKSLNKFNYLFNELKLQKYRGNSTLMRKKMKWIFKQLTKNQVKSLVIDLYELSGILSTQIIKSLDQLIQIQMEQNLKYSNLASIQRIQISFGVTKIKVPLLNIQFFKNLKSLILKEVKLQDQNLYFLDKFQNLEQIEFSHEENQITGNFLSDLFQNKGLKIIKIESKIINFQYIRSYLKLKGNSIEEICINSNKQFSQVVDFCPNLNKLFLSKAEEINDQILDKIKDYDLKQLLIQESNFNSQAFDTFLAKQHQNLESFNIIHCKHFNDQNLKFLLQNTPRLKQLTLVGINQIYSQSFMHFKNYGQHLQQIQVDGRNNITDQALRIVFNNCRIFKYIGLYNFSNLTSDTIKVMKQNCRCLEGFELKNYKSLNEDLFKEIISISNLGQLSLQNCNLQNDKVIEIVAGQLNLRSLNISYNENISSEAFPLINKQGKEYLMYQKLHSLNVIETSLDKE